MDWKDIYYILNNASVAAVIAVLSGLFIYKWYKSIDQKIAYTEKLSDGIFLFEQHCNTAEEIVERWVATSAGEVDKDSFWEGERNTLSNILLNRIPEDISNIHSIIYLYFKKDRSINDNHRAMLSKFKIWSDFIVSRMSHVEEGTSANTLGLSEPLIALERSIKELIDELKK